MWDERKHPREKDGKFTGGNGGNRQDANYRGLVEQDKRKKAVNKYSDDPGRDAMEIPLSDKTTVIANQFNRLKTSHHEQHAKDFGFKTIKEYENAAIEFCTHGEGIVYRGKRRGDIAKYNEKTGEFAVVKNGNVKTYYYVKKKKFEKIMKQEGFHE